MNFILFDDPGFRANLLPFTFTRPVAAIRTGILTIAEKWEKYLHGPVSYSTAPYLQKKFPLVLSDDNLWINGGICPDESLLKQITKLKLGEGLIRENKVIALRTEQDEVPEVITGKMTAYKEPVTIIDQPWKIFQFNGEQIIADFRLITANRVSSEIGDPHTKMYSTDKIFVEEGAYVRAAVLNAESGPIYLGKNCIVQEGSLVRGPFALGEGSHLNMGSKMRGNVSIGPHCKVGGEVSNVVIFAYSNKAHDGFLGCSVLGEWCNLGADTNTSNLKNNYDHVRLWNYEKKSFVDTGLMFCGLMMGDHSKSGINTMFNTGTTVGVCTNVFGGGFPRNFIPSFAWGGVSGFTTFLPAKAFETATRAMQRRSVSFGEMDRVILEEVFKQESLNRVWEKK